MTSKASYTSSLFLFPLIVSFIVLVSVYLWGGVAALLSALLLTILEVTLSFDNAVVNAKVLKQMSPLWQRRFLTWGILFAVFGTRIILPIFIVAVSVALSPLMVALLAFNDPRAYGELLHEAHYIIGSFGGSFLLMVALKYFFDTAKQVHWIVRLEQMLSRWGRVEAIEIGLTLSILLLIGMLIPDHEREIVVSGVVGVILFIIIEAFAGIFSHPGKEVLQGGLVMFIYLNILDSAFSLDGVVGAFAISNMLPVIIAGLGIGAYFVRTFTVYMVQHRMLDTLVYLEHGAHWAIFGLAFAMLFGLAIPIPEVVTGLVGLLFIGLSYVSSLRQKEHAA